VDDLFVVVDLALVVGEKRGRDVARRRGAAVREQYLQHQRLVDVRHPHLGVEELDETLIG
jgi:hypothetical protein